MINVMEHFVTDFQEFKTRTAERIDKIEHLLCDNVMGHDTVQTKDIKQQVELLQNKNSKLEIESEIESESLLKVVELLSVQQINAHEINENTENFIAVKETGKNKKTKLNHHQDYRIPLRNLFEILPIEECQDKPSDEESSMSSSFDHAPSKRKQKKQSTKYNKQPEAYITNKQYEEPLE